MMILLCLKAGLLQISFTSLCPLNNGCDQMALEGPPPWWSFQGHTKIVWLGASWCSSSQLFNQGSGYLHGGQPLSWEGACPDCPLAIQMEKVFLKIGLSAILPSVGELILKDLWFMGEPKWCCSQRGLWVPPCTKLPAHSPSTNKK